MFTELKRSLLFTLLSMLAFGGAYHVIVWGIGRVAFPAQSEGSLLSRPDGTVAGSRLIAQAFTRPAYFHARPSAVGYNAASTGGSNFAPSNLEHLQAVQARLRATLSQEQATAAEVTSEMLTTSGSGLDPHISLQSARLQAARVAAARAIPVDRVHALVDLYTESPTLGVFGRPRVNVLEINLAIDRTSAAAARK